MVNCDLSEVGISLRPDMEAIHDRDRDQVHPMQAPIRMAMLSRLYQFVNDLWTNTVSLNFLGSEVDCAQPTP